MGIGVATLAGAVTSGLGYALWYRVLPQLPTTTAAIAQLSVPVIAVAGVIAGRALIVPCDSGKAIRFDRQRRHFRPRHPTSVTDDAFGIGPIGVQFARNKWAKKVDVDLVKVVFWIVEFVDQTRVLYGDCEAGFFHHLADQIVGQGAVCVDTTTGRAPKMVAAFPRIHQ